MQRRTRVHIGGYFIVGQWLPVGSWYGLDIGGLLSGFCRDADPALVVVAGDPDGDGVGGCVPGYATGARPEQVVDVAGHDEQHGSVCHFEGLLDAGGVE